MKRRIEHIEPFPFASDFSAPAATSSDKIELSTQDLALLLADAQANGAAIARNDALAEPRRHYLNIYHQHNDAVLSYFASRPDDLLVFDLESANWADLCAFLGHRKPLFRSYPHRNAAAERERRAARKRQRQFGHM